MLWSTKIARGAFRGHYFSAVLKNQCSLKGIAQLRGLAKKNLTVFWSLHTFVQLDSQNGRSGDAVPLWAGARACPQAL